MNLVRADKTAQCSFAAETADVRSPLSEAFSLVIQGRS